MKLLLPALLFGAALHAQTIDCSPYTDWADKPVLHTIPDSFKNSPCVIVLDERINHFTEHKTTPFFENGRTVIHVHQVETIHHIFHFLNDSAGLAYRRLIIFLPPEGQLDTLHARIILPDGKVVVPLLAHVSDTLIGQIHGMVFTQPQALPAGSELEYAYTMEGNGRRRGTAVFQDTRFPCLEARFVLWIPGKETGELKGYDGLQEGSDSTWGDDHLFSAGGFNLPALTDTLLAFPRRYLARVSYRTYQGTDETGDGPLAWASLGWYMLTTYAHPSAAEIREAKHFLAGMPIPPDTTENSLLRVMDGYVKDRLWIGKPRNGNEDGQYPVHEVLQNGGGSPRLMLPFYVTLCKALNIPFQLVLTPGRSAPPMDPEVLEDDQVRAALLYFPGTALALDVNDARFRYPYIGPILQGGTGFFVTAAEPKKMSVLERVATGQEPPPFDPESYVHEFRQIPFFPADSNVESAVVTCDLDKPLDSAVVVSERNYTGYAAYNNHHRRDTSQAGRDMVVARWGGAVLHLGKLIGRAEDVPWNQHRILPLDLYAPFERSWRIIVHIPEGYTVKNPDVLTKKILFADADGPSMGFSTEYKLTGQTLEISVKEGFLRLQYPVEEWDHFNQIRQAVVDFNSVDVQLTPA